MLSRRPRTRWSWRFKGKFKSLRKHFAGFGKRKSRHHKSRKTKSWEESHLIRMSWNYLLNISYWGSQSASQYQEFNWKLAGIFLKIFLLLFPRIDSIPIRVPFPSPTSNYYILSTYSLLRQFEGKDRTFRSQLHFLASSLPILQHHVLLCKTFSTHANKFQFLQLVYPMMERMTAVASLSQPMK